MGLGGRKGGSVHRIRLKSMAIKSLNFSVMCLDFPIIRTNDGRNPQMVSSRIRYEESNMKIIQYQRVYFGTKERSR